MIDKTAQQTNDALLTHILEELRRSNISLQESNRLHHDVALKVAVIHARTVAIFGPEGGEGGSYGRLKRMVYRHEKYFNKVFAILAAIPLVGGAFAWIIDHFFPGILRFHNK